MCDLSGGFWFLILFKLKYKDDEKIRCLVVGYSPQNFDGLDRTRLRGDSTGVF